MAFITLNPSDTLVVTSDQTISFGLSGVPMDGRALVNSPSLRSTTIQGTVNGTVTIYKNPNYRFFVDRINFANSSASTANVVIYKNAVSDTNKITGTLSVPSGGTIICDSAGVNIYDANGRKLSDTSTPSGSTQVATPLTGETVTINAATTFLIINPAGTIAALTLNFPTPNDGTLLTIVFTQIVTAITTTGATQLTALSSATLGQITRKVYSTTLSKWC